MRPVPSVALALALWSPLLASAEGPTRRTDLEDRLGALVCAAPGGLPLRYWAQGVTEAQIEGRLVVRRLPEAEARAQAERRAKALAKVRRYGGYAAGVCADGRAWSVAMPAPTPLARDATTLTLPKAALAAQCLSWRADYAAHAGGAPRQLRADAGRIALAGLDAGVLSVTCQPKSPQWRGPVLWHLSPVGALPGDVPPQAEALAVGANPGENLVAWVNRIRTQEKRKPVNLSEAMSHEADRLAIDGGLSHNRKLLKKAADALQAGKVRLLGEDRVVGRTVDELGWLLWHSPRHRALLLNPDATLIGVATRRDAQGLLAVLVLGDHEAQLVGKKDKAGKAQKTRL